MKNNRDLHKDVQDALAKDASFTECIANIYILVNDGAVIISGTVNNDQLRKTANKIIKAVPGVNLLIEDLRVEAIPTHRIGVQIDWASGRMALT